MRDYYIKSIKTTEDKIHPIIKLLVKGYSQAIPKAVAVLDGCLMDSRTDSTLYVKAKWERELGEEIPEGIWYDMWKTYQITTQSLKWRQFSWKNLIRYFITPKFKSKQINARQPCWRLGNHMDPDHTHIFWKCTKTQPFWGNVHSVLCGVLGYVIPKSCLLYFGHLEGTVHVGVQYLVRILLVAEKKNITKTDILSCK